MNRHTNTHTDGRTNQLIESIGPEGRCFENWDTQSGIQLKGKARYKKYKIHTKISKFLQQQKIQKNSANPSVLQLKEYGL